MFQLFRLEEQCYEFIAKNIEVLIDNVDFHAIILEDASTLKDRHETDTIDIIDNVRYHLTAASLEEAHDKLEIIDNLLINLNLDA